MAAHAVSWQRHRGSLRRTPSHQVCRRISSNAMARDDTAAARAASPACRAIREFKTDGSLRIVLRQRGGLVPARPRQASRTPPARCLWTLRRDARHEPCYCTAASPAVDDGLQVSERLVVARLAPNRALCGRSNGLASVNRPASILRMGIGRRNRPDRRPSPVRTRAAGSAKKLLRTCFPFFSGAGGCLRSWLLRRRGLLGPDFSAGREPMRTGDSVCCGLRRGAL